LVIPEIVVREVVGQFRTSLVGCVEKLTAASRTFGQLDINWPVPALDVDRETATYRQKLDAAILAACGSTPHPPDVDVLDLADRAIDRRRPFDGRGSGFRDALIWENLVQEMARPGEQWGTFVSADKAAFWQGPELAPDLAADLRRRGLRPEQLALVGSVSDFIKNTGSSDPALDAAITELVESGHHWIRSVIEAHLVGTEVDSDTHSAFATVEALGDIDVVVSGTYSNPETDDIVFVELDCSGEATLSVVIRSDADIGPSEAITDKHVAFVDTAMTIPFRVTASYRKTDDALHDVSVATPHVDLASFRREWLSIRK